MHASPCKTPRAFTLIEVLVAVGIIIVLTAFLAMGLGGARDKARHKATLALVAKIKVALESYHAEFRDYPPDGYDDEPGFNQPVNDEGMIVGEGADQRRIKGSAALIYYLCRPLTKISRVGSQVGVASDPRNLVQKRVGPFLELTPKDVSKPYAFVNGEEMAFNPNHRWNDNDYWDNAGNPGDATRGFKNIDIIDAYGRPLCYDKVKTADPLYWQPNRFQDFAANPSETGWRAHSDQDYFLQGKCPLVDSDEPEGFEAADADYIRRHRVDPRFRVSQAGGPGTNFLQQIVDAIEAGGPPATEATAANHQPRNVGGYDLWSAGRSWVDPRDDVVSWGD